MKHWKPRGFAGQGFLTKETFLAAGTTWQKLPGVADGPLVRSLVTFWERRDTPRQQGGCLLHPCTLSAQRTRPQVYLAEWLRRPKETEKDNPILFCRARGSGHKGSRGEGGGQKSAPRSARSTRQVFSAWGLRDPRVAPRQTGHIGILRKAGETRPKGEPGPSQGQGATGMRRWQKRVMQERDGWTHAQGASACLVLHGEPLLPGSPGQGADARFRLMSVPGPAPAHALVQSAAFMGHLLHAGSRTQPVGFREQRSPALLLPLRLRGTRIK